MKYIPYFTLVIFSILIIHPLHTCRNTCKHFVGNCPEHIGKDGYRKMISENLNAVAFFAINVSNINHTNIHTDIAHIRSTLSVHQAIGVSIAQVTVQPSA